MVGTPHFSLAELTRSAVALARRIDNDPPPEVLPELQRMAEMLERIRAHLGQPVIVTSGYRSPALNAAVGSRTSSDHLRGQAADIVAPGYGSPARVAKALAPVVGSLGIGQLILERVKGREWVHVSTRVPDRIANRVITIDDNGAHQGVWEA